MIGIRDVPPVGRHPGIGGAGLEHRAACIQTGMDTHVPGFVEVVLGPGSGNRGDLFSIDIKIVISFTEPVADGVLGREDGADIMPVPLPLKTV